MRGENPANAVADGGPPRLPLVWIGPDADDLRSFIVEGCGEAEWLVRLEVEGRGDLELHFGFACGEEVDVVLEAWGVAAGRAGLCEHRGGGDASERAAEVGECVPGRLGVADGAREVRGFDGDVAVDFDEAVERARAQLGGIYDRHGHGERPPLVGLECHFRGGGAHWHCGPVGADLDADGLQYCAA